MPTFDLVVVGSGGGPSEANLSGYLLKTCTSSWEDGIVALEAGSGLGALKLILDKDPTLFGLLESGEVLPKYSAARIYSFVRTFLITHAHLDHIMGLVLLAGTFHGCRRRLMGARQTLEDLESIFKPSRLWPNLASWNSDDSDNMYLYDPLITDGGYRNVHGDISVRIMPLSHGSAYESSAFFIRHDPSMHEFLFLGDVEPDSLADEPQTIEVWRTAAGMIPERLDTIFIECSWPTGREDGMLYGHLTPEHLAQELENLAVEVIKARKPSDKASSPQSPTSPKRKKQKVNKASPDSLHGALRGLRVYVIHCKEDMESLHDRPIHHVVTEQVRNLMNVKKLEVEILHAEQGTRIQI